jgi:hypothetical protein
MNLSETITVSPKAVGEAKENAILLNTPMLDGKVIGCGLTPDECGKLDGKNIVVTCTLCEEWVKSAGPVCGFAVPKLEVEAIRSARARQKEVRTQLSFGNFGK